MHGSSHRPPPAQCRSTALELLQNANPDNLTLTNLDRREEQRIKIY